MAFMTLKTTVVKKKLFSFLFFFVDWLHGFGFYRSQVTLLSSEEGVNEQNIVLFKISL